jgi:hypothetical protein
VVFDFKDNAQRKRWSNLPASSFKRHTLGRETDKAFALLSSLNEAQRKQAILGFEMRDLVLLECIQHASNADLIIRLPALESI